MPHQHLHHVPAAQMFCQLLRQIYRARRSAWATKPHQQALKAATLTIAHAGIHQRRGASEELMHTFLLIEIVGHRLVFARKSSEELFASGVGKTPGIENETAAGPGLVFQRTA